MDLHAGQLVDRVGVALGLPFPSGPHLETLARQGNAKALVPVSMDEKSLQCHLSGAEAQLMRMIQKEENQNDIAAEVYSILCRTVLRLLKAAADQNRAAGQEFLAANAKKAGIKTTASGLQYEVITEGTGAKPTKDKKVRVHYTGSLIDGKVFDSSVHPAMT